jgi:peroxiredoxin
MKKTVKLLLVLFSLAAALAVAGCSGGAEEPASPGDDVVMAPDFRLETLDGTTLSLSDLRGRPVLLNFWATWCGPCRIEMPHFQALYADPGWRASGLEILAVNVGEPADRAQAFVEENGFTFPVLLDTEHQVATAYNLRLFPTSFFIDENGIIKAVRTGTFIGREELEQALTETILGAD